MQVDFDHEPSEKEPKGGGGNTRILLLVLLLLVAVFGYLYYFTGLIKPREEAKAPEPVQTSVVKQPIPPRPEEKPAATAPEAGKPEPPKPEAAAAKKEEPKAAPAATVAKPEEKKAEAARPSPEKAKAEPSKEAKTEAAKTAKKEASPEKKEVVKPAEKPKGRAKPEEKKVAQAPAADKGKPAPREKGEKTAEKAVPSAVKTKAAEKKEAAAAGKTKAAKPAPVKKQAVSSEAAARKTAPKGTGEYTLRIGEYVVANTMDKDKEKVQDAGLTPVVKQGPKKKEPMVRLYVGEFADRDSARKELAKLSGATAEGFVLNEGGKYRVYAGSYFVHDRAVKEQERLAAQGVKLSLRKTSVTVPTLLLTAGKFSSREEALKAGANLRKKGLAPVVIENGR